MATPVVPEPWTRVSAVLAMAAGEPESPAFDTAAEATASRMRGIRRDWANRPTCTWSVAEELLSSLRAERARVAAANEARAIAFAQAHLAPRGVPMAEMPVDAWSENVSPAELLMRADPMVQPPRRKSVLQELLERRPGDDGMTIHPIREGAS